MRDHIMEGIRRHTDPLGSLEHVNLIEARPGHSRLSWDVPRTSLNLYGKLHGGVIFTLCDMAAGIATYAYKVSNVTQQGTIHFIKGVQDGTLYIEADVVHKGSKTVIHHVTITTQSGQLVADATFTMFLFGSL